MSITVAKETVRRLKSWGVATVVPSGCEGSSETGRPSRTSERHTTLVPVIFPRKVGGVLDVAGHNGPESRTPDGPWALKNRPFDFATRAFVVCQASNSSVLS